MPKILPVRMPSDGEDKPLVARVPGKFAQQQRQQQPEVMLFKLQQHGSRRRRRPSPLRRPFLTPFLTRTCVLESDRVDQQDDREDEEDDAVADAAGIKSLPESLALRRGADPSETRGAAWAAEGAAAAVLAELERPSDEVPATRARSSGLGAAAAAVKGTGPRKNQPMTAAAVTKPAKRVATVADTAGGCCRWRSCRLH